MRILLAARGSRGDVQPILAVARGLLRRGHRVRLCVPGAFADEARSLGVDPGVYAEDMHQAMRGFAAGGLRSVRSVLAWFARTIDDQFRVMVPESEGVDLFVTGTNEIAAPSIAEYRGVPFYRVTFGPMMTGYGSHALLPWQNLPGLVNRAGWEAINRGVDLVARGPINRNRARLGMGPTRDVADLVARHGHTLFAMNTTLAPPCPSWGAKYEFTYTGYPHPRESGALPAEVVRFIEAGPPPLYLGFGSVAVRDPARWTRRVVDAVVRAGCRVVLGQGWAGLGRGVVSDRVLVVGALPHGLLFPRMAGVLGHGGAGTTHTAARAGVPQLVMPQFGDQHYWGHRVAALGLGPAPVDPARLTTRRLARVLRELVDNPRHARHAAALGHIMRDEDGVASIIAAVEAREGGVRRAEAACS